MIRVSSGNVKVEHYQKQYQRIKDYKTVLQPRIVNSKNLVNRRKLETGYKLTNKGRKIRRVRGRGRVLLDQHGNSLLNVNRYIALGKNENDKILHNLGLLLESNVCARKNNKDSRKIDLLLLIFSAASARKNRAVLRKTWLTYTNHNTNNIRYLFLLGKSNESVNNEVKHEHSLYQDILQGDFNDTYHNLTMKTITGLEWAVASCNQTQFLLKTDDDVWMNIPFILQRIKTNYGPLTFTLGGKCGVGQPHRTPHSKYYVPYDIYPYEYYPPYCSGTGYLTTITVATKIINISKSIPFFPLEDIYVALCLKKLGISVQNIQGFYNSRENNIPLCYFKTNKVLMMHSFNSEELDKIWIYNQTCSYTKRVASNTRINKPPPFHVHRNVRPRGMVINGKYRLQGRPLRMDKRRH
ncbi:hypothetical protein SNE40_010430 [Patella caerulea]